LINYLVTIDQLHVLKSLPFGPDAIAKRIDD
jgi:hypothetical protein